MIMLQDITSMRDRNLRIQRLSRDSYFIAIPKSMPKSIVSALI